jgi:predicted enzyme related to lactoylglutathione lyase
MERVTGIGGIFFKAENPAQLYRWYEIHPGIKGGADGAAFHWRDDQNPEKQGMTAWAIFPRDSRYFDLSRSQAMINYRVDNLDALLEALRAEGVEVVPHREEYDYGRFAWIVDPEGNKIELREPK